MLQTTYFGPPAVLGCTFAVTVRSTNYSRSPMLQTSSTVVATVLSDIVALLSITNVWKEDHYIRSSVCHRWV